MNKQIPFEKLSKKEKRRRNSLRRNLWGDVKPVTRKIESRKLYDRKKGLNDNDFY